MILGCSADPPRRNCKFADRQGLDYALLCDEDKVVCEAYGVWGSKRFMGRQFEGILRTTFVIDEEGRIAHVFPDVSVGGHDKEVLAVL